VLRLVTRLNIGGPARHALILTRELSDEYPTVLAAGVPDTSEGELADPAVAVERVPLVREVSPANDVRALHQVRRLLQERRPHIVHTHMAKAGTIGRLAAISVRPRPLTVHTFHGHVLEGYFRRPVERAVIETERWLARRTDLLLAVSPQVRDDLVALGVGRPSQVEVVPLGLDLDPFLAVDGHSGALRRHIGVTDDTPLVGIVGRLVPIKEVSVMLSAMPLLPGVHLAVVGDGVQRPALEREAAALGLSDRVHFTGWWRDMHEVMADLDVVALTSRNEGTPVALIEALAAARPVVGTAVGGVPFVVEDTRSGFLVSAGDEVALSDRIRRLLDDPALRGWMGEHGRASVADRFGSQRLVADVRAAYAELLARRSTDGEVPSRRA
jgi:glycosyltransferase involved in cell wall biosynthesis